MCCVMSIRQTLTTFACMWYIACSCEAINQSAKQTRARACSKLVAQLLVAGLLVAELLVAERCMCIYMYIPYAFLGRDVVAFNDLPRMTT